MSRARPERGSYGDFLTPADAARHEQVRHVDAGDEQNEPDGAQQQQQRLLRAAHDGFGERRHNDAPPFVLRRVRRLETRGDDVEVGAGLREGDAGFQAGDHAQPVGAAVLERFRVEDEGHPELRALRDREAEAAGHDARHGSLSAFEGDRLADDRTVAAEAALPELEGEDGGRIAPGLFVFRIEGAAEHRGDAQQRKERRRDGLAPQALGRGPLDERHVVLRVSGHGRERPVLRAPVDEVQRRGGEAVDVPGGVRVDHAHELRRLRVGQRAKHRGVHDRENGRVEADAEREREDGHGGKARALAESPQRVTDVLEELCHLSAPVIERTSPGEPSQEARFLQLLL
jgi:hypothetical protein